MKRILLILTISFYLINIGFSAEQGLLKHTILSPYNQEIISEQSFIPITLDEDDNGEQITTITSRFRDFVSGYSNLNSQGTFDPFCRIGGWYKINVFLDMKELHEGESMKKKDQPGTIIQNNKINSTLDLFYCKTTKDLINKITIPQTWQDNSLILYCNNGQDTTFNGINKDIELASSLNLYKACILKNLDLEQDNTILYALEVGNSVIDSNSRFYYNKNSEPQFLNYLNKPTNQEDLSSTPNQEIIVKNTNKKLYLNYDEQDSFYSLSPFALDTEIITINSLINLDTVENINSARAFLIKKIEDNILFGYDVPANLLVDTNKIDSMYIIDFSNFQKYEQKFCLNSLKKYSTLNSNQITGINIPVICTENKKIILNENKLDSQYGTYTSFNIFKNLILNN